jgi:hypothetical protein
MNQPLLKDNKKWSKSSKICIVIKRQTWRSVRLSNESTLVLGICWTRFFWLFYRNLVWKWIQNWLLWLFTRPLKWCPSLEDTRMNSWTKCVCNQKLLNVVFIFSTKQVWRQLWAQPLKPCAKDLINLAKFENCH